MSWDTKPEEYVEEYREWQQEYRPVKFVEYTEKNLKKMEKQDPRYVWTDHDTCENSSITPGFHFFGDPPRCCWATHGWHITEVAHAGEVVTDSVSTTAYLPCSVCNADGDGEGVENCPGPAEVDGAETADGCQDGFIQWYFD